MDKQINKLSYIEQMNGFWQFYDENKTKISPSDIVLYMVLLRYCNKLGWVNPFMINPYLMSEINPLSQNTYYKCLENLHKQNLIKWTKGKHNVSYQQVTIIKFNASLNNSIDTSIVNSLGNSLGNNNNTIIQIDDNTIIDETPQKNKKFVIPGINEIEVYFLEQKSTKAEAARFCNYYTANGWYVGSRKMKDWQAAARNWIAKSEIINKQHKLFTSNRITNDSDF